MLANVTQNLTVQIVPVNDPIRDKFGHAGYRAYVTHATDGADKRLTLAALEGSRGIVPASVGYGSSSTARMAALNAIDDYTDKFGRLCVADTNDVA